LLQTVALNNAAAVGIGVEIRAHTNFRRRPVAFGDRGDEGPVRAL
jgi:hypothetical protein